MKIRPHASIMVATGENCTTPKRLPKAGPRLNAPARCWSQGQDAIVNT